MKKESRSYSNIRKGISLLTSAVLLFVLVFVQPSHAATATYTYISAEPIPNIDVVGAANLQKILGLGYSNLELWSTRLLVQCRMADNVISALSASGAISTVNPANTQSAVAAGGFEAVTDPTFVLTLRDSGAGAVGAGDVGVLDNALGYVLNQGRTVHFSLSNPKAYDFSLDYAVIGFSQSLSGLQAKAFFDHLGTIDSALWSGTYAGFTQIGNKMVFLKPAASKQEFISGLSTAASTYPSAAYETLNNNGQPTTAKAGISFPANDWLLFPGGDQYLANIGNSAKLRSDLAALRQKHLSAVVDLLKAIDKGNVTNYLNHFQCP